MKISILTCNPQFVMFLGWKDKPVFTFLRLFECRITKEINLVYLYTRLISLCIAHTQPLATFPKSIALFLQFGCPVFLWVGLGVWPESKSFSDEGLGPIPSKWKGYCQSENKDGVHCNRSIVIFASYADYPELNYILRAHFISL